MAGAEWAGYKKYRILKPTLWIGMIPVSTVATVMAWTKADYFNAPGILSIIAWIVFPLFVLLFIYSLYFEIPLRKTYIDSEQPVKVVTDGTYSLCRHPALLWFTGWMLAAVFISRSITLAIAAPVWILSYIGCLFLEEKVCCMEIFADEYKQYQRTTPMLIPTFKSIKSFWMDSKSRLSEVRAGFTNNRKELK